jgi:hypothetical protein
VPTATALSGDVTVNSSGVTAIGSGVIVDADVSASAAIAGTKIAPAFGGQDITVSTANRSITNTGNFALSFGTNNTTRVTIPAAGGISIATGSPDRIGADFSNNTISTLNFGGPNSGEGNFQLQYDRTGGTFKILGGTTGSQTERMRIDASGNVGIGASPARKFHTAVVAAPAAAQSSKVGLLIQNGDGTGTSGSPNSAIIQFAYDPASPRAYIEAGTLGNDFLAFGYETTERMRIDGSGNVGIGTTTMSQRLNVEGSIHLGPGSGFRYISTTSEHLAFVKKAGGPFHFYFRKTDDGLVGGANSTDLFNIKDTGQVRFVPLSADPAGAETGDVYYNSSTNKLRVYNGSWVNLH